MVVFSPQKYFHENLRLINPEREIPPIVDPLLPKVVNEDYFQGLWRDKRLLEHPRPLSRQTEEQRKAHRKCFYVLAQKVIGVYNHLLADPSFGTNTDWRPERIEFFAEVIVQLYDKFYPRIPLERFENEPVGTPQPEDQQPAALKVKSPEPPSFTKIDPGLYWKDFSKMSSRQKVLLYLEVPLPYPTNDKETEKRRIAFLWGVMKTCLDPQFASPKKKPHMPIDIDARLAMLKPPIETFELLRRSVVFFKGRARDAVTKRLLDAFKNRLPKFTEPEKAIIEEYASQNAGLEKLQKLLSRV